LNSDRETVPASPDSENSLFLSAFLKVLTILGEQSKDLILLEIEKKYGFPLESQKRPITPREIEDTIMELFEMAGELIMKMVKAEYHRIS